MDFRSLVLFDSPFRHPGPVRSLTDKTIVLDIDETLVHAYSTLDTSPHLELLGGPNFIHLRDRLYVLYLDDVEGRKGGRDNLTMVGTIRPGLEAFLQFCFDYFQHVIIWSAGKYDYVHATVDLIFEGLPEPDLVLTYDDCETVHPVDEDGETLTKPLAKIVALAPYHGLDVTFDRIMIVDNLAQNFIANPENGILIPDYEPEPTALSIGQDDQALSQLVDWFLQPEVRMARDVRRLDKRPSSIFGHY